MHFQLKTVDLLQGVVGFIHTRTQVCKNSCYGDDVTGLDIDATVLADELQKKGKGDRRLPLCQFHHLGKKILRLAVWEF